MTVLAASSKHTLLLQDQDDESTLTSVPALRTVLIGILRQRTRFSRTFTVSITSRAIIMLLEINDENQVASGAAYTK